MRTDSEAGEMIDLGGDQKHLHEAIAPLRRPFLIWTHLFSAQPSLCLEAMFVAGATEVKRGRYAMRGE